MFATSFTLGGYLYSTRSVTKEHRTNLDQVKDQTRKAAGLSIQTPVFGASIGGASASGNGSQEGEGTLNQQVRLTWDAHGGNTLLASKSALPFLFFSIPSGSFSPSIPWEN